MGRRVAVGFRSESAPAELLNLLPLAWTKLIGVSCSVGNLFLRDDRVADMLDHKHHSAFVLQAFNDFVLVRAHYELIECSVRQDGMPRFGGRAREMRRRLIAFLLDRPGSDPKLSSDLAARNSIALAGESRGLSRCRAIEIQIEDGFRKTAAVKRKDNFHWRAKKKIGLRELRTTTSLGHQLRFWSARS